MVGVEMGFGDRGEPVVARPMRVSGDESGEALVVGPRGQPQRQPIEGDPLGRVFELGGERVAAGEIALAVKRGGGGEGGAVEGVAARLFRVAGRRAAPSAGAAIGAVAAASAGGGPGGAARAIPPVGARSSGVFAATARGGATAGDGAAK